ncbi:MAG: FadR family transcriptional regulator [Desulfobacterium sp.]|nr:FadR family transcriptional regulator [Desulfobacterium sp.]
MIEPIQSVSLKDLFIRNFEKLIFSGHFKIGDKLPPERELAKKMGVSRPVVHEGLVDLASKGLVTMVPRRGTIINDFRKHGSLFVLTSLFKYSDGQVSDKLLFSVLDLRMLFEIENAGLAAGNRTREQMEQFQEILEKEKDIDHGDTQAVAALDFEFHLALAMASNNLVYPLLLNSLKQFYLGLSEQFFAEPLVVPQVFEWHIDLVQAIEEQHRKKATAIMKKLLAHGESHLRRLIHHQ